nr:MAG: aldehyde dehydrogenase [Thermoproteus sp. AZ2]
MPEKELVVLNPATEEVLAKIEYALRNAIADSFEAAYEAFLKWSELPLKDRLHAVRRAAELLEKRAEEVLRTLVAESGKPIRDAEVEMLRTLSIFRASVEEARHVLEGHAPRVDGYEYPLGNENRIVVERREPIGVIAAAQSYNNPASTFAHKVAPNIVAGNTVVLKPSSYTPLTAMKMAEILHEAGVPKGVVQVLVARGEEFFDEALANERVAGVAFTGSTQVALQVWSKAAAYGKKFMGAPGGSDPFIVFDDADLERAAATGVRARFENAGQNCNAAKRFFVHRKLFDQFVKTFVDRAASLKVDDPMDPSTDMGPVISDKMVTQMAKFVKDAVDKGGELLYGGRRLERKGFFFAPTVIKFDQFVDAAVMKDEVFGPIAPIVPFETEEEVVKYANSTIYGLQAAVFTADYRRAFRVAKAIRAGAVMINDTTRVRFDALPYGGVKMSGFGWREGVRSTMYFFTEPKYYVLNIS